MNPPTPGPASSTRRRPARKLSLTSAFASAAALAVAATAPSTPSSSAPPAVLSPPVISLPPSSPAAASQTDGPPALGLFQQCLRLSAALERVPGFTDRYGSPASTAPSPGLPRSQSQASLPSSPSSLSLSLDSSSDVVGQLWACLRTGSPLCFLFNALGERQLPLTASATRDDCLDLPTSAQVKQAKHLTAKFIMALRASPSPPLSVSGAAAPPEAGLGWDSESCFSISDLFRDDTNGFIRVVRTVGRLLELLEARGRLLPPWTSDSTQGSASSAPSPTDALADPFFLAPARIAMPAGSPDGALTSPSAPGSDACAGLLPRVIQELLTTERNYVADLERIQAFAQVLSKYEALGRDMLHAIFCNLDQIVDVQRRLLARIEQVLCPAPVSRDKLGVSPGGVFLHEVERQAHAIGRVFCTMGSDLCIYQPFCANYSRALELATREASAIVSVRVSGRPDVDQCYLDPFYSLGAFLIKPIQRICKYPLLFDEMIKRISTVSTARAKRAGKALTQARLLMLDVVSKVNDSSRSSKSHVTADAPEARPAPTSPMEGSGPARSKDEPSSRSYFDFVPNSLQGQVPSARESNGLSHQPSSDEHDARSSASWVTATVEELSGQASSSRPGSPRSAGFVSHQRSPIALLPPLVPWAGRSFSRARSAPVSPTTPSNLLTVQSGAFQPVSDQEVLSSPAFASPSHVNSTYQSERHRSNSTASLHRPVKLGTTDRSASISSTGTGADVHIPDLHGLGFDLPLAGPTASPLRQAVRGPPFALPHDRILRNASPMRSVKHARNSPGHRTHWTERPKSPVASFLADSPEDGAQQSRFATPSADTVESTSDGEAKPSRSCSTEASAQRSANGSPTAQHVPLSHRSPLARLESNHRLNVRPAARPHNTSSFRSGVRDAGRHGQGRSTCLNESWSSDWPKLDWENLSPQWPFDQTSSPTQEPVQPVVASPGWTTPQAPGMSAHSSVIPVHSQQFQSATDWQDNFERALPVLVPVMSGAPTIEVQGEGQSPALSADDVGNGHNATSPAACNVRLPHAPSVASSLATITAQRPAGSVSQAGSVAALAPTSLSEERTSVSRQGQKPTAQTPQRPSARTEKVTRDLLAALGLSPDPDSPREVHHARGDSGRASRKLEASKLHTGEAWSSPPASPTPSRPSESGDDWSYRSSITRSTFSSCMSSTAGDSVGLMTPLSAVPSLEDANGVMTPFWHGVPPEVRSKQAGSTATLAGTPLSGTSSSRYWGGMGHTSSSMSYSASHASASTGATTPVSTSGWGLSPLMPSTAQFAGAGESERWSTSSVRPPSQAPSMDGITSIDAGQHSQSVIPFPTAGDRPCPRPRPAGSAPHHAPGPKAETSEPALHGFRAGIRSPLRSGAEKPLPNLPTRARDAGLAGHRPLGPRPSALDLSDGGQAGTKPPHSPHPPRLTSSLTRLRAHVHNPF